MRRPFALPRRALALVAPCRRLAFLAPRRTLAFFAALLSSALAAIGCGFPAAGPVPPPLTVADVDTAKTHFPSATKESLDAGRDLFAARCNGCHNYPDVWKVDDAHWPEIIKRMGRKAGLDEAQSRSVLSFVLVARSRPAPQ